MKITTKKVATVVASGALLFNAFATSAYAANTVQVVGNGELSTNGVNVSNSNSSTVTQGNTANISNSVNTTANTGGNNAVSNTGGSVAIQSGNSQTGVDISNLANINKTSIPCSCLNGGGDANVLLQGNGHFSDNSVGINNSNNTSVSQNNDADFDNNVNTSSTTGDNNATGNTAGLNGGLVTVWSGDTLSQTKINNAANANSATFGASAGTGTGGSMNASIAGNGELSSNGINLSNDKSVSLEQANSADFDNWVNNTSVTGGNNAVSNTGANVLVHSGNALSGVGVNNLANFNSADLGCGCATSSGTGALIGGNGEFSTSSIGASNSNDMTIDQSQNNADIDNSVGGGADTGTNNSFGNTAWGTSLFRVESGSTQSVNQFSNSANVNSVGPMTTLSLPGGFNFNLGWNAAALWSLI